MLTLAEILQGTREADQDDLITKWSDWMTLYYPREENFDDIYAFPARVGSKGEFRQFTGTVDSVPAVLRDSYVEFKRAWDAGTDYTPPERVTTADKNEVTVNALTTFARQTIGSVEFAVKVMLINSSVVPAELKGIATMDEITAHIQENQALEQNRTQVAIQFAQIFCPANIAVKKKFQLCIATFASVGGGYGYLKKLAEKDTLPLLASYCAYFLRTNRNDVAPTAIKDRLPKGVAIESYPVRSATRYGEYLVLVAALTASKGDINLGRGAKPVGILRGMKMLGEFWIWAESVNIRKLLGLVVKAEKKTWSAADIITKVATDDRDLAQIKGDPHSNAEVAKLNAAKLDYSPLEILALFGIKTANMSADLANEIAHSMLTVAIEIITALVGMQKAREKKTVDPTKPFVPYRAFSVIKSWEAAYNTQIVLNADFITACLNCVEVKQSSSKVDIDAFLNAARANTTKLNNIGVKLN